MQNYLVERLYKVHGPALGLEKILLFKGGSVSADTRIYRPGLELSGFFDGFLSSQIIFFGRREIEYLKGIEGGLLKSRLNLIISQDTPFIVVADGTAVPGFIKRVALEKRVSIFLSEADGYMLFMKIQALLDNLKREVIHATLLDIFGMGVLIFGKPFVGKSEAAFGLLDRGHRLIADDVVEIRKNNGRFVGRNPRERTILELKGSGIIDVERIYGISALREEIEVDLIVQLERSKERGNDFSQKRVFYFMGVSVDFYRLFIKSCLGVAAFIEAVVLKYMLKKRSVKQLERWYFCGASG